MKDLSSPHELMAQIEADARSLDSGGRQLAKSIQKLSGLEQKYQAAVQSALIEMYHVAKEGGERLPAEDVRQALAHRQVPKEIYGSYLAGKAEVDALRAWCRTMESALSARQSLLSALRAELTTA